MNEEQEGPMVSGHADSLLDDLLRSAVPAESLAFERPSMEAIDAYLLGTATETQKEEVRLAMARSVSFRREMLESSEEIERLGSPEVRRAFDRFQVAERPGEPSPASSSRVPFWRRAAAMLAPPPAFAYAAALLFAAIAAFQALRPFPAGIQTPAPGNHLAPQRDARQPGFPPVAANPPIADALLVEDARSRSAGGAPGPREVVVPESAEVLRLGIELDPVEGDESGAYEVRIRDGDRPVLRAWEKRDDLVDSRALSILLPVRRLPEGKILTASVTYREPGHALDGLDLVHRSFRVVRIAAKSAAPVR